MTTQELLAELERRGVQAYLDRDGKPRLRGDTEALTEALLKVLRWHRDRLVAHLKTLGLQPPPPTLEQALAECARLGVTFRLDGAALRADGPLTRELAEALLPHREAIIERLRLRPVVRLRQWRWLSGMTHDEGSGYKTEDVQRYAEKDAGVHPGTATHWRYQGEAEWKEIRR